MRQGNRVGEMDAVPPLIEVRLGWMSGSLMRV